MPRFNRFRLCSPLSRGATLLPLLSFLCCSLNAQTTIEYNVGENHTTDVVLDGETTLHVNGTDSPYYAIQSGVLSGSGSVRKTGSSTLFFTAENTYTGGTFVDEGDILFGSYPTAAAAGSVTGDITLAAGTGVGFRRSNAVVFDGNIDYIYAGGTPDYDDGSLGSRDGLVEIFASESSFTLGANRSINVRNLHFEGGGTLNLSSNASINTVYTRLGGSDTDTIVNLADGASFGSIIPGSSGYVLVGDFGSASPVATTTTLNIADGATVDLSNVYLSLGGSNPGTAVLNVGAGATLTANVDMGNGVNWDDGGSGGGDAIVNLAAGATANLSIEDSIGGNASASADGGDVVINVQDASLNLGINGNWFYLGGRGNSDEGSSHRGGDGALNLAGAGTSVDLRSEDFPSRQFTLGGGVNGGNGSITVTDGATLKIGDTYVGGEGGGDGSITVSGSGSTLLISPVEAEERSNLTLGSAAYGDDEMGANGANGTLSLSDQATGTITGHLQMGGDGANSSTRSYTGGNGTLDLSTNASLTVKDYITVGGMNTLQGGGAGPAGNAVINIATGATLAFESSVYLGGDMSRVDDETTTGNGTLNLGAGTLSGYGHNGNTADIVISSTGTLNIGYDGSGATTAPVSLTLTSDNPDPEEDGPSKIYNAGTINFRHSSGTFTLAAPIADEGESAGTINQLGAGTTVLTGDNSGFTGATTVSAGTLRNDGTLGGAVTAESGGILGGVGTFTGLVTIGDGGILAPGDSPGTITFDAGLMLDDGAVLNLQLGDFSDLIRVSGGELATNGIVTLNLFDAGGFAAGTYDLIDGTSATSVGNFDFTDFQFGSTIAGYTYTLGFTGNVLQLTATASAVPEPATYAALTGALALGLAAFRRRRSRTISVPVT